MQRIAAAAVALLVVAAGVAATPLAAADPSDESASFGGDGYVTVVRGEDVDISVSHSTDANLTIGGEGNGFEVSVPLGGSGSRTITLDTYNTSSDDPADFLSADNAELVSEPIDEALVPGEYDLTVTMNDTVMAAGTLEILPREETTSEVGIAPGSFDFEEAGVGGSLDRISEGDTVARGDRAAVVANVSGLSWALPASSANATLDDSIDVSVVELDPEPNTVAEEYTTGASLHNVSNVGDAGEFAVFWDADVTPHGNSNNTYEFRVTLTADSEIVEEDEVLVRERVRVVEPFVELSASPSFTLAPWDDRQLRVTGETNRAPGTTFDVRAFQSEPREVVRNVVEVGSDGTFGADFAFPRAAVPSEFPLWVQNYRDQTEHTVELTAANASLSFADQQVDQGAVTVGNVSLSHGGFVAVTKNDTENGTTTTTVGVSPQLDAGDHGTVSVPLADRLENETALTATAMADANRNGTLDAEADVAYSVGGAVVEANATVQPEPDPAGDNATSTATTPSNGTTTTASSPNGTAPPATTTQRSLETGESAPLTPNRSGGSGGGSSSGTVPLSPALVAVAVAAAAALAGRQ